MKKKNEMTSKLFMLFVSISTGFMMASCNNTATTSTAVSDSGTAEKSVVSTTTPAAPPPNFKHQMANVNGVNIHYVIGGEGEPLVLVHGFGQNWFMWNRLLPELSKHFTIIAPDLRGVGESDKPAGGYDKKTMATDIHELVKKLGYKSINLAGHDIGLMVAYAYAAQFGDEVKKWRCWMPYCRVLSRYGPTYRAGFGGLAFSPGPFPAIWYRARQGNF